MTTSTEIAQELVERKLSGRRIVMPDSREVKSEYQRLLNTPENIRRLDQLTSFKSFDVPTQSRASPQDLNPYQSVVPPTQTRASPTDTRTFTPRPQVQSQASPPDIARFTPAPQLQTY